MTVKPGEVNLTIYRGSQFRARITCRNKTTNALIDFTGKKARAQFRRTKESTSSLASIDTESLGGIVLGGAAGTIDLTILATVTRNMKAASGYWDLEIYTTEDDVDRYFEGDVIFDPEVTRA